MLTLRDGKTRGIVSLLDALWHTSQPGKMGKRPLSSPLPPMMNASLGVLHSVHFEERFIVYSYTLIINGETVEIPRDLLSLTPDMIQTLFPNVLAYLSKKLPSKRNTTTSSRCEPHK